MRWFILILVVVVGAMLVYGLLTMVHAMNERATELANAEDRAIVWEQVAREAASLTIECMEQCLDQYGDEEVRQCLNACRPAR